jgi:hypothetical protein
MGNISSGSADGRIPLPQAEAKTEEEIQNLSATNSPSISIFSTDTDTDTAAVAANIARTGISYRSQPGKRQSPNLNSVTPAQILQLQQTIGNQAVQRLLSKTKTRQKEPSNAAIARSRSLSPTPGATGGGGGSGSGDTGGKVQVQVQAQIQRGRREEAYAKYDDGQLELVAYTETLSQMIAYNEYKQGNLLGRVKNGPYYRVDAVFGEPSAKDGFRAYGLIPDYIMPEDAVKKPAPPILLYRGSGNGAGYGEATVWEGAGFALFAKYKQQIRDWLAAHQNPKKPIVTGHSLGGALAQRTVTEFTALVSEVYTYGAPGLDETTYKQAQAKKAQLGDAYPKTSHYVSAGDIIPKGGHGHTPGKIIMITPSAKKPLGLLELKHQATFLHEDPSEHDEDDKITSDQLRSGLINVGFNIVGGITWFFRDKSTKSLAAPAPSAAGVAPAPAPAPAVHEQSQSPTPAPAAGAALTAAGTVTATPAAGNVTASSTSPVAVPNSGTNAPMISVVVSEGDKGKDTDTDKRKPLPEETLLTGKN